MRSHQSSRVISRLVILSAVAVGAAACGGAGASSTAAVPTSTSMSTPTSAAAPDAAATDAQAGIVAIPARKAARVPDDVPEHLSLSLGGGGGPENCPDIASLPPADAGGAPREAFIPAGMNVWCYCGLEESEGTVVTGTLTMPDGASLLLEGTANAFMGFEGTCVDLWHSFSAVPPRAPHTFEIELSGRQVVDRFTPVIGRYPFEGFQPGEPARVIVYAALEDGAGPEFVADMRIQADADGSLIVEVGEAGDPLRATLVYVVGQATPCRMYTTSMPMLKPMESCDGEAGFDNPIRGWTYDAPAPAYVYWQACPDAPRSELHAGDHALVTKRLDRLPVFAEAGSAAEAIDYIPAFENVEVQEGPVCAGGLVWWKIAAPALFVTGWAPEREDESSAYLLYQQP